jgi:hypothetical protein
MKGCYELRRALPLRSKMTASGAASSLTNPMSEIIAPSAAELEAFKAAAKRIGHAAREIECNMVEAFAAVGRTALSAAYPWSGKPPVWLPLTRRPDPTIGRKRRARRARGRRIENRRPYSSVALAMACLWGAHHRADHRLDALSYGVMSMRQARATFLDPSLGEPWEGTDEADQDGR